MRCGNLIKFYDPFEMIDIIYFLFFNNYYGNGLFVTRIQGKGSLVSKFVSLYVIWPCLYV